MSLIIFIHKDTTWPGVVMEVSHLKFAVSLVDKYILGLVVNKLVLRVW